MAERKAQQKWYPPDWDPSQGNLNAYHGEAWRTTAATVNGRASAGRGVNIIRMEMPFNVWCHGCKGHIGRGVRFNAEKRKVGDYFSTKIWRFRMKCHLCDNWMELETDPKNHEYKCVSGMTQKAESFSAKDAETAELLDDEEKEKLEDPLYKLEHANADAAKASQTMDALQAMRAMQSVLYEDDYANSRAARSVMRKRKKDTEKDKRHLKRRNIQIELPLAEDPEDVEIAKTIKFGKSQTKQQQQPTTTATTGIFGHNTHKKSGKKIVVSRGGGSTARRLSSSLVNKLRKGFVPDVSIFKVKQTKQNLPKF